MRLSRQALGEYNEMIKNTTYNLCLQLQHIDDKMESTVPASGSSTSNMDIDLSNERQVTNKCLNICQNALFYLESLAKRDSILLQETSPGNSANALQDKFEAQLLTRQALNDNQASLVRIITRLQERLNSVILDGDSSERVLLQGDIQSSMNSVRAMRYQEFVEKYGPGYMIASQNEEQIESSRRQVSNDQEQPSIEEQEPHEDIDDATSTSSTLFSDYSTSSASSYASQSNALAAAAITEVVTLFLDENDIQHFLTNALAKQERYSVLKGLTDLLKWLGRRLKNGSDSQIEKGLAKLFSSRQRNFLIVNRLLQEIESRNSNGDKREVVEMLRNQETSKECLEKYLDKQLGPSILDGPSNEETYTLKNEESEGSEYDDGEDGEADESHNVTSNIETAKRFLKSNESFLRFKEELEDFVEPLKNQKVWSKILWDGDERVRFDLSHTVRRLTNMDKLKLAAEEAVGMPILWWPLKQPRKHLPSGKIRIIWICVGLSTS